MRSLHGSENSCRTYKTEHCRKADGSARKFGVNWRARDEAIVFHMVEQSTDQMVSLLVHVLRRNALQMQEPETWKSGEAPLHHHINGQRSSL